jgi:intein-encoded DNA endonuclease-like protein
MKIKKLKRGSEKLSKEKARIIAHLIGDGALYKTNHDYVLKYEVSDKELLERFEMDIIEVYGLKPNWEINLSGKTGRPIQFVRLRSKLAFEDLVKYASYTSKDWHIKKYILNAKKTVKREFLKALFDDEGSVIPYGKLPIVRLYSINRTGLIQIQKLLDDFSIKSKIVGGFGSKRNVYAVVIKDVIIFYKKIGFNLKRKNKRLREAIGNKR